MPRRPPPLRLTEAPEAWHVRARNAVTGLSGFASAVIMVGSLTAMAMAFVGFFQTSKDAVEEKRRHRLAHLYVNKAVATLATELHAVSARQCRALKRDEESCQALDAKVLADSGRANALQNLIDEHNKETGQ